jgi:ubiquinone/menaquinone biosynthesis C-methylase UbiE
VRESNTTEAESEEGRFVISQFYNALPAQEDIAQWYAGFTPEGYNEWARVVNFTEPQHIIDQCVKSTEEGGMGVAREAVCLDIGSGTGIVGQAMQNSGFTNLGALDVSTNFLDAVRERGFY